MSMELEDDVRYGIAADWLQRLDDPQLKQEDIQSWLEWFETSDENRKAFEEVQALRMHFRELPEQDREELKRRTRTFSLQLGRRSVPMFAIAASVCALALAFGLWWSVQSHSVETYLSAQNQHRVVTLDDGSSLVLGADSVVDVRYSPLQRSLHVQRGEAYFEVRHNRLRPFIVQAGDIRVTAVGTAFNVQRGANRVTVTVTEGRVKVTPGSAAPDSEAAATPVNESNDLMLAEGQQAVLPLIAPASPPMLAKAVVAQDWSRDRARFINAPLSEIVQVINRHASTRLTIEDPRVADLTYTGTIFRSHVDEWISSLPQVFPVRAVPLEDGSVALVSKQAAADR
ncbi:FecR family protein [Steroidobacter sp.]|uniref:FecR family protein n=1 Tax=Steroidobacter sp. TaxID=1978227 RepID=UPI001A412429|nr:FecR domain-containing protein [Steroidobacter sp.]MBL8265905.1 FecR domain-containing protein [Steroidobacter sp.]